MRILWIIFLLPFWLYSQWTDDFSGNRLMNWKGDTSSFIINSNRQLQLMANDAGEKFIFREIKEETETLWGIYFELKFAPSGTNKIKLYLTMDQPDPIIASSYYIEIGENGSNDNWKFYLKNGNTVVLLGQGELTKLSTDPAKAFVQARRTQDSSWIIETDYNGGRNFTESVKIKDSLHLKFSQAYFGIQCTYTATRADKFILDDLSVNIPQTDKESPEIISHSILDSKTLQLNFNEALDNSNAENTSNIQIRTIGNPSFVKLNSENQLELTMPSELQQGLTYTLNYKNYSDKKGNTINTEKQYNFKAEFDQFPKEADLIITEFFSDPDPAVGLPSGEFVEIYNSSDKTLRLDKIKISDGGNPSAEIQNNEIQAGEFVILCAVKDSAAFKLFGRTIGIASFPVLNNDADQIILFSKDNLILDQIHYTSEWHTDRSKSEGGHSIELFYPNQSCKEKNSWGTSSHPLGGTPGKINSSWDLSSDNEPPVLISAIPLSQWEISLRFNEVIEEINMTKVANYNINLGVSIASADLVQETGDEIILLLNSPLSTGIVYSLEIISIKDCTGNEVKNVVKNIEIPSEAEYGEIMLNELLFNPTTGGVDYIELYNNTGKSLSTKNLYLSNLEKDERWINTNLQSVIESFSYLVITTDPNTTINNYPHHDSTKIFKASLVSMDDDKGRLRIGRIKNGDFIIIDSVNYSKDWHNPFIKEESGVALEKINPSLPSFPSHNWTSASSIVQYGSPGLKNSQFTDTIIKTDLDKPYEIESLIISPDQDGKNDQLIIKLNFKKSGYKHRLRIFDLSGNEMSDLSYSIVGTNDIISWNAADKDSNLVSPGNYIAVLSFVHPSGEALQYKERLVVNYK